MSKFIFIPLTVFALVASLQAANKDHAPTSLAMIPLVGEKTAEKTAKAQRDFFENYIKTWNYEKSPVVGSGELDAKPVLLKMVSPFYPPEMHRMGKEATITIDFLIDINGNIAFACPIDDDFEGFSFAASAVVAVWQWKFKPCTAKGKPVSVKMRVPIVFQLLDEDAQEPEVAAN